MLRLLGSLTLTALLVALGHCACDDSALVTPDGTAGRIVAVGDLHGDLSAARRALTLAGAIDEDDHWVGGELVLVQLGDILDRGDEEQAIIDLLCALAAEAEEAGGAVHVLNGNHELMNVALDLRYVTPGGFADFADAVTVADPDSLLASFPAEQRARVAAFRPGGPYARILAQWSITRIVGDNLFVHGGVTPQHIDYGLERLNAEVRAWLLGEGPAPEGILRGDSPVWDRHYSSGVGDGDCDTLAMVLDRLGVKRMVVGHTVQPGGITSYCARGVWCIDSGMSAHYGGEIQVLELKGDTIRVLPD
jgi:hypothetical protein